MKINKQSRQKYELLEKLLKSFCEHSTIFYQSWHLSLRKFQGLDNSLLELLACTTLYERLSQYIDSFEDDASLTSIIESKKFFIIWQVALLADVDADPQVSAWLATLVEVFNYLLVPASHIDVKWLDAEGFTQGALLPDQIDLVKTPKALLAAKQGVKNA